MALFTEEEKTLRRRETLCQKEWWSNGLIEEGDKIPSDSSWQADSLAGGTVSALVPGFSSSRLRWLLPMVMRNIPIRAIRITSVAVRSRRSASAVRNGVRCEYGYPQSPCFPCSWNWRRLGSLWQRNRVNKIALGHHAWTDILETLPMK